MCTPENLRLDDRRKVGDPIIACVSVIRTSLCGHMHNRNLSKRHDVDADSNCAFLCRVYIASKTHKDVEARESKKAASQKDYRGAGGM